MLKKIFLVDGAAGTGKTDLVEFIKQKYPVRANILHKYTTRPKRDEEDNKNLDLIFCSDEDLQRLKKDEMYYYDYGDKENGYFTYGFLKKDLLESLKSFEFTIVIVRSKQTIDRLIHDCKYIAYVVPIFIHADTGLVEKRLSLDGYSKEKIENRLKRSESCWQDYLENDYLETPIIINNSNKADFHRKINQLFNSELIKEKPDYIYINPNLKYLLITPLLGYKNAIQKKLERYPFEKNVFLMMKFRDSNKLTYMYIKQVLEKSGYNCVRADEAEWKYITRTSFNPMAVLYCCKYGIALFDEPEDGAYYNPNVTYELGMMQNQNKECLILKHTSLPNPPFDIVKDLYQTYTKEIEFEQILNDWISGL